MIPTIDNPIESEDQARPLSRFIAALASPPMEEARTDDTGMEIESLEVTLPVECRVDMETGTPVIRVMTAQRTETSVRPVLHYLRLKVESDAS